jgi:hypothetical protein
MSIPISFAKSSEVLRSRARMALSLWMFAFCVVAMIGLVGILVSFVISLSRFSRYNAALLLSEIRSRWHIAVLSVLATD